MDEEQRRDSDHRSEQTHEPPREEIREQHVPQEPEQHEYKPQKHGPTVVHIKKRRPLLHLFLMILLVGATAGVGYMWYQADQDLQAERAKVVALQSQNDTVDLPASIEDEYVPPSFFNFIQAYNIILNSTVDNPITEDIDEAEILAAVAEYNEIDQVANGTAVLAVYQIVKPGTAPTGDLSALVYIPASDDKPAGFVDVFKASGGEWAVFVDGM